MKKIISIIILVLALSGITIGTIYTLKHKGIRTEIEQKTIQSIEKITSNVANQSLTEIYNVYLNKEKHKLKLEYFFDEEDVNAHIDLLIYLDGETIFNDQLMKSKTLSLSDAMESEEFNLVQLQQENLKILKFDEQEYLLVEVLYSLESKQERYFLFNSDGESYFEDGILIFDDSVYYQLEGEEELNIFYDTDYQILAKCEEQAIYVLELNQEKKKYQFLEYKYTIENNSLEKELLNTYDNIIIVEN